jgi:hypothetical protein
MKEFYTNNSRNLHIPIKTGKLTKKQKREEIRTNLQKTINFEESKVGGGNKELIAKLQLKLDKVLK